MTDASNPLFHMAAVVGGIVPSAADPTAAHALMLAGMVIIVVTALWAAGGLGAAAWTALARLRRRRPHPAPLGSEKPSIR